MGKFFRVIDLHVGISEAIWLIKGKRIGIHVLPQKN